MTEPTTPAKKVAPKTASKTASSLSFADRAAMATAPAWRPEENDILRGEVMGTRVGTTADYPDYPVLILRNEDGGYTAFHAFHGVAQDTLSTIKPKRGDVLTIQYLGEHVTNATKDNPEKDQTTYHLYYIERDGDTATDVSEEYTWGS